MCVFCEIFNNIEGWVFENTECLKELCHRRTKKTERGQVD